MKDLDIIEQITSKCPWISRDQILTRLEKEKQKTSGLISDEALLKMIAAEFGCESAKNEADMPLLLVKDLFPGLNDVTVAGRVLAVFPTRTFDGAKKGKLAALLIGDNSGVLRVVLWNEKTAVLEAKEIEVGRLVSFSHAYTREYVGGKVELHVSEKSEVKSIPEDSQNNAYPEIRRFSIKIDQLPSIRGDKRAIFAGTVKRVFPASTFERKDSTHGKVMRFIMEDSTGTISVVVWNEKADELENSLKIGHRLQVVNGKIKKGLGEEVEINVDADTYLGSIPESEEFFEIVDLKEGMNIVNVEGEVVTKPAVRDVKTSKGEIVRLATFELKDETGRILVSAWRKQADAAANLDQGRKVAIKNAYVKKGFSGNQRELSTRNDSSFINMD
jgi:replication factor A1